MKHLIIYAHPIDGSLNNHFQQIVKDTLLRNGQEVIVRDLYQLNFNPVLSRDDINGQRGGIIDQDVKREQDYIIWADAITFIYPIWWTGMPAIMKGYIDRVFSYGFAYRYDAGVQKGLLTGKSAYIINSHGKSTMEYQKTGMDKALQLTSDNGIYSYCGLEIKRHFFFDQADRADSHTVESWGSQLRQVYLENELTV